MKRQFHHERCGSDFSSLPTRPIPNAPCSAEATLWFTPLKKGFNLTSELLVLAVCDDQKLSVAQSVCPQVVWKVPEVFTPRGLLLPLRHKLFTYRVWANTTPMFFVAHLISVWQTPNPGQCELWIIMTGPDGVKCWPKERTILVNQDRAKGTWKIVHGCECMTLLQQISDMSRVIGLKMIRHRSKRWQVVQKWGSGSRAVTVTAWSHQRNLWFYLDILSGREMLDPVNNISKLSTKFGMLYSNSSSTTYVETGSSVFLQFLGIVFN